MSGRQHSAVKHCANYFYVPLEDDYLLAYETLAAQLDPIKEEQGKPKSASSDCKAMIAATLEAWLNSKRATAKNENDLYVYLTIDQWVQQLRYRYSRTMIIQCHNEMAEEGSCIDPETGETLVGTIKKRPYIQNMFGYLLHLPVIQSLLDALPEKSPFEMRARPALGRPKKSSQKTDGISSEESSQKLNGINSDGINEKQSRNGPNYRKSSQKTDGSFYITQNHNYTETNITQNHGVDANAQHATLAFHPEHHFIAFDDLEQPTTMYLYLQPLPDWGNAESVLGYSEAEDKWRDAKAWEVEAYLSSKGIHVEVVVRRERLGQTIEQSPSASYSQRPTGNALQNGGTYATRTHGLTPVPHRVIHRDADGHISGPSTLPEGSIAPGQDLQALTDNNNHSHEETRNGLMDEPAAGSVGAGRGAGTQTAARSDPSQGGNPDTGRLPVASSTASGDVVQGVRGKARAQAEGAATARGGGAGHATDTASSEVVPHQGSVQTTPSLLVENPVAVGGNSKVDEQESKPARGRRKPKVVDPDLMNRVSKVYDAFDKVAQEASGDPGFHYDRTKKTTKAISEWLPSKPTEKSLRETYMDMVNTPADPRTGFSWSENMTIEAVIRKHNLRRLSGGIKNKRLSDNHVVAASAPATATTAPLSKYWVEEEEDDGRPVILLSRLQDAMRKGTSHATLH